MSTKSILIVLATAALLGSISQANAATPLCGAFDDNSGTITVSSEGRQFSINQLMNDGRFSGRGPQFGCWMEIGTSPELRGTMMYSYRVTDPSGQSDEFGPYGIQAGGFGSGSVSATHAGIYRVEYFTVSRDNGSKASIGSTTFTMNP